MQKLEHPPYSPDLALLDFYLFTKLKKNLAGKRFTLHEKIISTIGSYFLLQSQFLQKRWTKCIEVKKNYVKNKNNSFLKLLFLIENQKLLSCLKQHGSYKAVSRSRYMFSCFIKWSKDSKI